jgi:hypothetical protein
MWSMSVNSIDTGAARSGTYTFGDLFGPNEVNLYLPVLKAQLDADLVGKSCDQLKTLSHETFKKAINDNPGYFVRP